MSVAVLDPVEVAIGRTQLDLDSGDIRVQQEGLDWGDAKLQQYLADARVGSAPVDSRMPNRTIKIPLGLGMSDLGTFDTARRNLQSKVGRIQDEGGWLKRQLRDGSYVFADVMDATLHLPDKWGEVGQIEDQVTLELECSPDFYGDEITLDAMTATGTVNGVLKQGGVTAAIKGDYAGRIRIIVTDGVGQQRKSAIGALRCLHYDTAATAKLVYDCKDLTPLDAASVQALAGSSSGSVIKHANLSRFPSFTPVLATTISGGGGEMTHRGTYRVWARYTTAAPWVGLQLLWGVGDVAHPVENPIAYPDSGDFYLVDLGVVRLDKPAPSGYSWKGVVQATGNVNGADIELDRLIFQPLDEAALWCSAKNPTDQTPALSGVQQALRAGATADSNAYGTTAWTHPTWATAEDGQYASCSLAAGVSSHYLTASTFGFNIPTGATISGIIAQVKRWGPGGYTYDDRVMLVKAGTVQTATNRANAKVWPTGSLQWSPAYGGQTDLWGTAWTPADINNSGFGLAVAAKAGAAAATAYIDSILIQVFYTTGGGFTVVQDAVVYPNRLAEFRTEGLWRQDSTGAVFGNVAIPGGANPRIPPSGMEGRSCELLVKAMRGTTTDPNFEDFTYFEDPGLDSTTVQVKYRPSYLFRP